MEKILSAKDVVITLEKNEIIKNCDLDLREGEFLGIIGANGVGKSTLLKALRGLLVPQKGSVEIFGKNLFKLKDKEVAKSIAYMQQDININFGFTAKEIVTAGRYPYLKWWQNESVEDEKIIDKWMQFTGVKHLAEKGINQVSGGEKQRIFLAKVLAQQTPIVFLDEPTASLDLKYQEEIFRYCQRICKENKSVIMVVHDLVLAAKFCSRLVLLSEGKVLANGIPAEVLTKENLKKAYTLDSVVYKNYVSGNLDIHTYEVNQPEKVKPKVRLLGLGNKIETLVRALYENNYIFQLGVVPEKNMLEVLAKAFQIETFRMKDFKALDLKIALQNEIHNEEVIILGRCYLEEELVFYLDLLLNCQNKIIIVEENKELCHKEEVFNLYNKVVALKNVSLMQQASLEETILVEDI